MKGGLEGSGGLGLGCLPCASGFTLATQWDTGGHGDWVGSPLEECAGYLQRALGAVSA